MKAKLNLALFIFSLLSLSLSAQSNRNKRQAANQSPAALLVEIKTDDVKSKFISSQDYLLSASSLKDNRDFGDSLVGFDEAAARADFLSRFFAGSEYFVVMNSTKREYINNKYKIGPRFANPEPQSSPGSNNRPGGGGNNVNLFPCVNEDFELTSPGIYNTGNAVAGWTIQSGNNPSAGVACNINSPSWVAGSPEFSIMATPILGTPWNGVSAFSIDNVSIPNSPLGGNNIARLQNSVMGSMATRMRTTFPVTSANTLFQFAYAGSWDGQGHSCCDQPSFNIRMYNCPGQPLTCSSVSLTPSGGNCISGVSGYSLTGGISWTNWVVNYIDLTPFIGTCVTLEVVNSDCNGGAHHGSAYFDARCGGALVGAGLQGNGGSVGGPVSFCAGAGQALINAPLGYATYQWYAPNPGNPPTVVSPTLGGNTPAVTIMNPVPGTVYTVGLVTASGCSYTAVDTLRFSTVQIIGIGTNSTCPGGASGSATVQGNGSGTGYNYNWYPVGTSSVIGTNSFVTGLAPGVYSVGITGFGSAGCGSAVTTVTIGVAPPRIDVILKPFCGNQAYLSASGSNFQWYNGLIPISGVNGGTLGTYVAPSPVNGDFYWLTYTSPQNCRDSVKFILSQTPAGNMYVANTTFACPNTSNATATINMIPASGSPPGISSYSVFSTGSTPAYTSAVFPTSANSYFPQNMAAGTYSIVAFDGSCNYSNSFTIQNYNFDYAVTPVTATLCPGNSTYAGISFSTAIVPNQYSFNWSPGTYITGSLTNISNIAVQIAPAIPIGSVITTIYTVTVRPAVVNCPITKTISITAVNLQIPNITAPAAFCTNVGGVKTITVGPSAPYGYTFTTGMGNWLGSSSGNITPTLVTSPGTNTFLVATSVGTCMVSNIGNFNVSTFRSAALSGTIIPQCSTNPCINLMNLVQNQTGAWSGFAVNSNVWCPNQPNGVYTLTYNTTSIPNPALCPDTRTMNVITTQTVAPFISPELPFCTDKPSFNMLVTPSGGTWSGGPPLLITPAGVVNPLKANLGNNVVTYVVNTGACVNTATTVLNATIFRTAALTASVSPQCKLNPAINLMGIVQNQSGIWQGPGVSFGSNIFSPLSALQTSNAATAFIGNSTYSFELIYYNTSTPNPTVCPSERKLIVHVVDPLTPTITVPAPHCTADAAFQLAVSPNTGSFTPTAYLSSTGWFNPSLSPVGNNQVQYTIGTNNCNAQDTKLVSIEEYVPPTITGFVPDLCTSGAGVSLSALTLSNSGTWTGPGTSGSSFNPGQAGAGNITITYNTSSIPSGLCPAQATLSVKVYSLATPYIEEEGPFCNSNSSVQLRVSPVGGVFNGMNTKAVDALGRFNPGAAQIGDNIINYSITAGPCIAHGQTVIKIERFVSADFLSSPGPFCETEIAFDMNVSVQNPGGVFSGPGLTNNSLFTPKQANIGNNNIITYVTHSMPTESLCPHTATVRVQVNKTPEVSIVSNRISGCAPVEVAFNTPSTNKGSGQWTLGDGSPIAKGLTANHTYTAPGTYSVVFNYFDEVLRCPAQATLQTPVTVYELPTSDFSYGPYGEDLTISDPEVQFTNRSTELVKNTYKWQIADMYELNDFEPKVTFPKIGKYEITLTATTIHGCIAKSTQMLEIKNDFGIFIPNSFTPNADDLNDVFIPVFSPFGLDAKTFDMEIFNRWGTSLYHTKDVTKGWNGSIQNKDIEAVKPDVYTYKIKYKDENGVMYNKVGHVTLLK